MNRRSFLRGIVSAAALGLLPGCSGLGGAKAPEEHELEFVALPGVLPMVGGREVRKAYEAWGDEFAEANPGLEVSFEELDFRDMVSEEGQFALDMALGEDSTVDAVLVSSYTLPELRAKELIAPLDGYLTGDSATLRDDYPPSLLVPLLSDGQLWGLPATLNPTVVRYSRALFEAAGVPEPSPDWSWEDFVATAQQLRAGLPERQFALAMGPGDALGAIYALGGRVLDDLANPTAATLDEPATREAIEAFVALMEMGVLPTAEEAGAYEPEKEEGQSQQGVFSVAVAGEGAAQEDMQAMGDYSLRLSMATQNGDAAMWFASLEGGQFGGMGGVHAEVVSSEEKKAETGIVLPPRGQKLALVVESSAFGLVATSEEQKEAWQWLRFLTDRVPPMALPARLSLLRSPEALAKLRPEYAALAQILAQDVERAELLPISLAMQTGPLASAIWRAWGGAPLDEELIAASEQITAGLE